MIWLLWALFLALVLAAGLFFALCAAAALIDRVTELAERAGDDQ